MEENFDRVIGLAVNEEVNEMLPPDENPPLVDNKGHKVILPEQGHELVGQGHFVALSHNNAIMQEQDPTIMHQLLKLLLLLFQPPKGAKGCFSEVVLCWEMCWLSVPFR